MTSIMTAPTSDTLSFSPLFQQQQAHQYKVARATAKERSRKLRLLEKAVLRYRPELQEALWADFRKPKAEVDLTEVYAVLSEIRHARKNLKRWMKAERVPTPLPLLGSRSWIVREPKGVCLIISPWNFPFQLAIGPLVSAIAAGNTVVIKPSEHTPATSAVIRKVVGAVFPEEEAAVVEGGVETATALLSLPFNHIFFTGSPGVGKVVMKAAARHLASVTLELGGKSPVIVDETADIQLAAKRIAWGKFLNSGQICIAPDYVLVHESRAAELESALTEAIAQLYGAEPSASADLGRMVNHSHLQRVAGYLEDARQRGARIVAGGKVDEEQKYMAPTIVCGVDRASALMQEEIFGPVLPLLTFARLEEAIGWVQQGEKPLALYLYSRDKKNIREVVRETRAGGTCVNNNDVHFMHPELPFGGSNNSGIGKSHGWYGFEAFSNARPVYQQLLPGALELLSPPYTSWKQRLIDLTVRWL
ncbi:aldehyde dehydrogenase family protein [Phaeodactylibacter luteus]|uniref:Aldehyde dehydrogenase n=2 Tax=Phaeodactylibacter luteus TaxID=1564516 RepID=A0A5C6RG52_9BACT|nr:aldehyde dehydrogenase family protein [Phaeodactylibacter luteus]